MYVPLISSLLIFQGPNPHNSLALAICKEILNTYGANLGNVPVLVRSLLPLQLSYDEPEFRENFEHLCRQVFEVILMYCFLSFVLVYFPKEIHCCFAHVGPRRKTTL